VLSDSYEPNNDLEHGVPTLTVPYQSAGIDPLSCGGADPVDLYKLTPPPGVVLTVDITVDAEGSAAAPLDVSLISASGDQTVGKSVNGEVHLRGTEVTGLGGTWYIFVGSNVTNYGLHSYEMSIGSFAPVPLTCEATLDGQPAEAVGFQVRSADYRLLGELTTDETGVTPPVFLAAGEEVNLELFRYGFSTHRSTRKLTMPASPENVVFAADTEDGLDQWEPNHSDTSTLHTFTVPGTIEATMADPQDTIDIYKVYSPSTQLLAFTLDCAGGEGSIVLECYDRNGNGVHTLYLRWPEPAELQYTLSIGQTPGNLIIGKAKHGVTGENIGLVHCQETGETMAVEPGGTFQFGPYPSGVYTLEFWNPNWNATPAPAVVALGETKVTQDFELVPAFPTDNYEPNDSSATAASLLADGSPSLVSYLQVGPDAKDYYKFDATAGDLVQLRVDLVPSWSANLKLDGLLGPSAQYIGKSELVGTGFQEVRFVAPETGTYTFFVESAFYPAQYATRIWTMN
jgi:hypothetical protein